MTKIVSPNSRNNILLLVSMFFLEVSKRDTKCRPAPKTLAAHQQLKTFGAQVKNLIVHWNKMFLTSTPNVFITLSGDPIIYVILFLCAMIVTCKNMGLHLDNPH